MGDGTTLRLIANLSSADIAHPANEAASRLIWGGEPASSMSPWAVFWRIEG
jgi:hypothetical protein